MAAASTGDGDTLKNLVCRVSPLGAGRIVRQGGCLDLIGSERFASG